MSTPAFSFEFFPPKTDEAAAELDRVAAELAALKPAYLTVTYGAGGSTRDGTLATLKRLAPLKLPLAAHLTFCATPKADLHAYVDTLWQAGIRRLVALRGDLPAGRTMADFQGPEFYHYTSDFVAALLARHSFDITVGAYPEKHPDAPSLAADIEALRKKCDAGAARAITQFFFDTDIYYRFLDAIGKAGITTPVYPGLMPIHDFARARKFAAACHATIPQNLHDALAGPDAAARAEDLLVRQIEDLAAHGVSHIHFYALNRAELCAAACQRSGLAV